MQICITVGIVKGARGQIVGARFKARTVANGRPPDPAGCGSRERMQRFNYRHILADLAYPQPEI